MNQSLRTSAFFASLFTFLFAAHSGAVTVSGDSGGVNLGNLPGNTSSVRFAGPDGFALVSDSGRITSAEGLADGQYRFEVYGKSNRGAKPALSKGKMNNGRNVVAKKSDKATVRLYSGFFRIVNGTVVVKSDAVEK